MYGKWHPGETVYFSGRYRCTKCGNIQKFEKLEEDFEICNKCRNKKQEWVLIKEESSG